MIEREQEAEEHSLVLKTLEGQDGAKRAWRLVGDVLVERTVAETAPDVAKNRDNLVAVADTLKKQLEAKTKELLAYQEKHKIRIKGDGRDGSGGDGGGGGGSGAKPPASGGQQGVLVSSS